MRTYPRPVSLSADRKGKWRGSRLLRWRGAAGMRDIRRARGRQSRAPPCPEEGMESDECAKRAQQRYA